MDAKGWWCAGEGLDACAGRGASVTFGSGDLGLKPGASSSESLESNSVTIVGGGV